MGTQKPLRDAEVGELWSLANGKDFRAANMLAGRTIDLIRKLVEERKQLHLLREWEAGHGEEPFIRDLTEREARLKALRDFGIDPKEPWK